MRDELKKVNTKGNGIIDYIEGCFYNNSLSDCLGCSQIQVGKKVAGGIGRLIGRGSRHV